MKRPHKRDHKGRFVREEPKAPVLPDWYNGREELTLSVVVRPAHVLELPKVLKIIDGFAD